MHSLTHDSSSRALIEVNKSRAIFHTLSVSATKSLDEPMSSENYSQPLLTDFKLILSCLPRCQKQFARVTLDHFQFITFHYHPW